MGISGKTIRLLFIVAIIFIVLYFAVGSKKETFDPNVECVSQCRVQDGQIVDPMNCCQCRTSGGMMSGPSEGFNKPFRACMCSFGEGYESYCYKLSTNFLLSQ